jgi:hypothetical protein
MQMVRPPAFTLFMPSWRLVFWAAGTHALIRLLEFRLIRLPADLVGLLSHAACPSLLTHRNVLASRNIQWRITASLRATATVTFLPPIFLTSRVPWA